MGTKSKTMVKGGKPALKIMRAQPPISGAGGTPQERMERKQARLAKKKWHAPGPKHSKTRENARRSKKA